MEPSSGSSYRPRNTHPNNSRRVVNSKTSSSSSSWCCSFNIPPKSPEALPHSFPKSVTHTHPNPRKPTAANFSSSDILSKSVTSTSSFPNSPQSTKSGLGIVGRIDPRRILSPGRVSPIDSDPTSAVELIHALMSPEPAPIHNIVRGDVSPDSKRALGESTRPVVAGDVIEEGREKECGDSHCEETDGGGQSRKFDVRLNLKGKRGACLALELSSEVLCRNSPIFADLISDHCRRSEGSGSGKAAAAELCRIEVPEVENLGVFRDAIELMFEDDITKQLLKIGAARAIDLLEVSVNIKFTRCISSCLNYLEAVPWSEEEEEKLRNLFTKFDFEDEKGEEIMSRLKFTSPVSHHQQQTLTSQLVRSITDCANSKARNELKSMVKGLLSRSSVYEMDRLLDIKEEELYEVSRSCLASLTNLFEEATNASSPKTSNVDLASSGKKKNLDKPLVESIAWQVDNINWLLEILLDRQIAEKFVDIWADQSELLRMHGIASPLVRYELSRVSAVLFVAMGTRKLQCPSKSRSDLLSTWFGPMLSDFGWLQRCRKGLDVRELEEAMGQALLTLPLKQQYELFMHWFKLFSKHGGECPNLSKAFQIWWRRTFLRAAEPHGVECR